MNRKIYFDRGITLIALIVTIIVLIILAGVSISMLTGENGLLSRAVEAKQKNTESAILENVQLALVESYIHNDSKIDLNILNSKLQNISGLNKLPIDENIGLPYIITYNGKGILITDDGNAKWVNSTGKNLFNENEITIGFINSENGSEDKSNDWWLMTNYIKCKSNTSYVLSYEDNNSYFQGVICFYDENKKFISGCREEGRREKMTAKSPLNAKYIKMAYSIRVNGTTVNRYNIQLEEGTQKTEYEPYFNL